MIAFAAAWGVFWLLLWCVILGLCLAYSEGTKKDDNIQGMAGLGVIVSLCWLAAVAVAAVLS